MHGQHTPQQSPQPPHDGQNHRLRAQQQAQDANRAHPNWRTYSMLTVRASAVPSTATTLQIWQSFRCFGHIQKIDIFENRNGGNFVNADITFKPVPSEAFWLRNKVSFNQDGRYRWVYIALQKEQRKQLVIPSETTANVTWPGEISFTALDIGFGVLQRPTSMRIFACRKDHPVEVLLNLGNSEIQVFFKHVLTSDHQIADRRYRFIIATNGELSIQEVKTSDGTTYLLLHQRTPPWYSRQLIEEQEKSHALGGKRWSEEDTWTRQTDIVDHKRAFALIQQEPVTVEKRFNAINIARWTTFALRIGDSPDQKKPFDYFKAALKDFNVMVREAVDFEMVNCTTTSDPQGWKILDSDTTKTLSLEDEWSIIRLPFSIRYLLEVCISHSFLSEYQITQEFVQRLAALQEIQAKQLLTLVATAGLRVYDPMSVFDDVDYRRPIIPRKLPDYCVEMLHATVTATGLFFHCPSVEVTNRIVRQYRSYADHFLRVRFEDDECRGQTRIYSTSNNKFELIYRRFRGCLVNGIRLGTRHYEFLAWGNSQLRENGCYFFAKIPSGVDAHQIRMQMGVLENENVVAKRAARMGQCFSTTRAVTLKFDKPRQESLIADIVHNGYTFTDGVGKISSQAALQVANQLALKEVPSAFQFRLGGCKGVLVISPELRDAVINIRKSQFKFDGSSGQLEIIRHSEFWQPYLNRQVILVLSALGVPDEVFLDKQSDLIEAMNAAMTDETVALRALRENVDPNGATANLASLIEAGFHKSREPMTTSLLRLWRSWSLTYLKQKAKIPISAGAFLLGCVDEYGVLRGYTKAKPPPNANKDEKIKSLPQIFVQYTNHQTGKKEIVKGICIVVRNPALHKGDIRVVEAVDKPELRHLCDVVVMPQMGDRDLPSMCGGGDLDGDDYIVIWDPSLMPTEWFAEPFHYHAPEPKRVENITVNDFIQFFLDYMQNDFLGRIAVAHLAAADFYSNGVDNLACLELTGLHSMAVDYAKTGKPAHLPRRLERTMWPHFMEKSIKKSYHSGKVLGKLYDAVKRDHFKPDFDGPFDERILNYQIPSQKMVELARDMKQEYDIAMQRIMSQHKIQTEFEVWSTLVLSHSKDSGDYKFHEEIGNLSRSLKESFLSAIYQQVGGSDDRALVPFAVAAYKLTHAQVQHALKQVERKMRTKTSAGMPFVTFPWLLQDTLIKIARRDVSLERIKTTTFVPESQTRDLNQNDDAASNEDIIMEVHPNADEPDSSHATATTTPYETDDSELFEDPGLLTTADTAEAMDKMPHDIAEDDFKVDDQIKPQKGNTIKAGDSAVTQRRSSEYDTLETGDINTMADPYGMTPEELARAGVDFNEDDDFFAKR